MLDDGTVHYQNLQREHDDTVVEPASLDAPSTHAPPMQRATDARATDARATDACATDARATKDASNDTLHAGCFTDGGCSRKKASFRSLCRNV